MQDQGMPALLLLPQQDYRHVVTGSTLHNSAIVCPRLYMLSPPGVTPWLQYYNPQPVTFPSTLNRMIIPYRTTPPIA